MIKIIKRNEYEDMKAYIKVLEKDKEMYKKMSKNYENVVYKLQEQVAEYTEELGTAKKLISDLTVENNELRKGQEALMPKKRGRKRKEDGNK